MKRITKSLNYNWYFQPDFKEDCLKENYNYLEHDIVNIPHSLKILPYNYFNEKDYQFTGTYFKEIDIEEEDFNSDIILKFFGVMNVATVYINNQEIIKNEGGYTPFEVLINDYLKIGKNILIVKVDGLEVKDIPPFGNLVDYLGYSGIYREVILEFKPKVRITKAHIFTDDIHVLNQNKMLLNLDISTNYKDDEFLLKLELYDNDSIVLSHEFKDSFNSDALFSLEVDNIERWTLEKPKLYKAKISIVNKKAEIIDSVTERFGFRTLMFTESGFLLNNQKIKLIGLNRHQSFPYMGYAATKSLQEKDADILKDLGCNIVRTSHYMQSDHFINRCDEIGLLVFEEIPGWNYIGDEHFKELSLNNLKTMINHHFNHPSICLWGVRINESKDDDDFYELTNNLAKKLDPTRQTGGVRNFKKSHLLEDVYTYNDFSHTGDNDGIENPRKVSKIKSPYLVTEYNGHVFPTKKIDSDSRRVEHALRHMNVIEYSHYYDTTSGAIGWCMADYNTHFQFGANDRICHHGVLDMYRLEKYAAYAYKSQKNPEIDPVLFVASNMTPGDYNLLKLQEIVVFTNLDYVKVYKNDEYIDSFYPDINNYDYSPHAPIIIDDLIGELLEKNENYSHKDSKRIKKLLLSYQKFGMEMPLRDKLLVLNLILRKVINFNDAVELYTKYLANQDDKPTVFRFEGYLNEKLVKTIYKGHMDKSSILIEPDRLSLTHGFTYDTVRVVVKMVDQFNNVLDYANEILSVSTDDNLEVIGPKTVALIGGSIGIYLKTIKASKEAKVTFTFNNYSTHSITFTIENGILEF